MHNVFVDFSKLPAALNVILTLKVIDFFYSQKILKEQQQSEDFGKVRQAIYHFCHEPSRSILIFPQDFNSLPVFSTLLLLSYLIELLNQYFSKMIIELAILM